MARARDAIESDRRRREQKKLDSDSELSVLASSLFNGMEGVSDMEGIGVGSGSGSGNGGMEGIEMGGASGVGSAGKAGDAGEVGSDSKKKVSRYGRVLRKKTK
jgi:hypothetical protein